MASVRGRVKQHIVRRQFDGAFQHAFQRLVETVAAFERQVIAIDDEAVIVLTDVIDDFRHIEFVVDLDLDLGLDLELAECVRSRQWYR